MRGRGGDKSEYGKEKVFLLECIRGDTTPCEALSELMSLLKKTIFGLKERRLRPPRLGHLGVTAML